MKKVDVVVIGAGAAGLMCAIEAGKRKRQVIVLDHANKPGKKILMSGGGRCNFTNYYVDSENFISHNPHFCKSALNRYTPYDFIDLVYRYEIPFHEKTLGQLFCDNKAKDILEMLLSECNYAGATVQLNTVVEKIEKLSNQHFKLTSQQGDIDCSSLVIATGGLSIPTLGASSFGYKVAEQFNIKVWPTRAGLVPLTLPAENKEKLSVLSGVAVDSIVGNANQSFRENFLFTHRGLSGPAILQISSYWNPGEEININLLPDLYVIAYLKLMQKQHPGKHLKTLLTDLLPKHLVEVLFNSDIINKSIATISHHDLENMAELISAWPVKPNGTEGYRTAEVTLGGVDCDAISSKTMEANAVPGLYFIGEVLDMTGWLGGYNFQWAWASGWAAGQVA